MVLCSALDHHRILVQVEFDTVAALMMGSDIRHGAIDIAHLDGRRRKANDAACWESLLVLSEVSIVAVAINAVDTDRAPVTVLVGKADGDQPSASGVR